MLSYSVRFKCFVFMALSSCLLQGETIGRWNVGQNTIFDLSADGKLVEMTDGESHAWALPASDSRLLRIEFGVRPKPLATNEEGRMVAVPFGYDSNSRLYVGDWETRTWNLVGMLPEALGADAGEDHLVVDPHRPDQLYWASSHTVWNSQDGGHTWASLKTLSEPVERLVLGLNGELYALTRLRAAFGPLENTEEGVKWLAMDAQFEEAVTTRVWITGEHTFVFEPVLGGVTTRELQVSKSGRATWRELPNPEPSKDGGFAVREYSARNATTQGCRFDVFRYSMQHNGWVLDNYWDFNFEAIRIRIDVRLRAGSRNCVWSAPFSSPYWSIEKESRERIYGGAPGVAFVRVFENTRPYAFLRAIAIHVENKNLYRGCLPGRGPNDSWAIVVQNARNGGTACQALQATPTPAAATQAGRTYLSIPLFGTNPSCERRVLGSIACVAERSGGPRLCTAGKAARTARLASGMGECLLPDLD